MIFKLKRKVIKGEGNDKMPVHQNQRPLSCINLNALHVNGMTPFDNRTKIYSISGEMNKAFFLGKSFNIQFLNWNFMAQQKRNNRLLSVSLLFQTVFCHVNCCSRIETLKEAVDDGRFVISFNSGHFNGI